MPGLGKKYGIEIEVISKPKNEYITDEYFATDLPLAPAVMVADEVVVEGKDVTEKELESVICRHLGIKESKGFLGRLFKRSQ
ncbi:MAG: hypothetical protein OEZ31_00780 [Nitrospirota bacterium]|nr:hypothetical protein [Nitrospirota bacterium]MDH5767480.1 hypothetical protein [Nitrospirota bacterium]